jgi:hypothetical protein
MAILVLAASCAAPRAQEKGPDKGPDSPYYPLRPGAQWTYRSGEQKVMLRVTKLEKVGDALCAVLETKRGDGLPITEHLGVRKDGLYRFKALTFPLEPPLCVLKLPPQKGASWTLDSRLGADVVKGTSTLDEMEITVPFGKVNALVVKTELPRGDQKFTITTYFARGVGMVKQTQNLGGKEITLELETFEEMK